MQCLTFLLGDQSFALDIRSVREIIQHGQLTPVPPMPNFVRGVINLRGAVLPILDLKTRLGLGVAEPSARSVIIVVHIHQQIVGLLVDAVSDILTSSADSMQPTPDIASEMAKTFVKGVYAVDGRMISIVALDNVLPIAAKAAA